MVGFRGLTTLDSKTLAKLSAFGVGFEKNREKELVAVGFEMRSV